jgi:large subunit ribosomal protein L25
MADVNIKANVRELSTKGAVNQLRKDGIVPGVLYSHEMEPVIFSVPELALNPVVYTTEMHLVDLKVGENEEVKCIVKDVQFDPVSDKIIHIDFQAITVGQVIQVQVPINILGQAIGVKQGGKFNHNLHKVDVECLPKHIPSHLDVDITNLEIGDSILIKDLKFENIKILNSEDASVAAVTTSRAVEEDEETAEELLEETESAEPELIGKGKSEEESEG